MAAQPMRIFSYLPNPRIWKAQIAAAHLDVQLEIIGDRPGELTDWLWDVNPRPLADGERDSLADNAVAGSRGFSNPLIKTDAFLKQHPFGTVPAAFFGDQRIGVFESNSILRATVRAAENPMGLYGKDVADASRIDSFLDEGLVFAREAQVYLLGLHEMTEALAERMRAAATFYLQGIERALEHGEYLVGNDLTIADIAFACDLGQFLRERLMHASLDDRRFPPIAVELLNAYPMTKAHLLGLGQKPHFAACFGRFLDGLDAT